MTNNKVITLTVDVFFVDGTAFLLTLSRRIQFVMTEQTLPRTAKQLAIHLKRVLRVYDHAGFTVRHVLMNGEFEKLKNGMPTIVINTTAAKKYVSEAEQKIRVVKERSRGVVCTLPHLYIPRRMKIEMVYFVTLWLNTFPIQNGISRVSSPRELVTRWWMDYAKHCRVEFGTYCEVHDKPDPSNSMVTRTQEGIALGLS
mmetsp:Transcript_26919/g.43763  ORF Transcript_26919/g.43763 Transcript_26919/m.43763 type:complete len:199 (+) Transcript_26919:1263-1859(+)